MALKGQKFNLDLDADNFQFNLHDEDSSSVQEPLNVVKDVTERSPNAPPPPPKLRSKNGFPEHRPRKNVSTFRQRQQQNHDQPAGMTRIAAPHLEPSDRAIANHIGKKHGFDTEAKAKAEINEENKRRLAQMSTKDIEEARAELISGLNPALVQRLLQRANIDEDSVDQDWDKPKESAADQTLDEKSPSKTQRRVSFDETGQHRQKENPPEETVLDQNHKELPPQQSASIHFPVPPRDPADFVQLDPSSETFLEDLRSHYFPDTPHDLNSLTWLQDSTDEEKTTSAYGSTQHAYAPSDIRFDFSGRLIPPSESETIPNSKGLHHHGNAPDSAGYTIPELAMLCRSSLPNQRCIAYRTLGRILYRLGRGDFGPKGSELHEGLWGCIEHERPLEVMMIEANRTTGHISAKAYATEALWLWRKGGGGDRGILKEGQTLGR